MAFCRRFKVRTDMSICSHNMSFVSYFNDGRSEANGKLSDRNAGWTAEDPAPGSKPRASREHPESCRRVAWRSRLRWAFDQSDRRARAGSGRLDLPVLSGQG